jgi:hypothetical protein
MSINRFLLLCLLVAAIRTSGFAHTPEGRQRPANPEVTSRAVCTNSTSAIEQRINNVRARLLGGGDCWWDLRNGRYIVPKVDPSTGQPEVSSIFAAAVWIGGVDDGGNLKLAAQDYRNDGRNDFWPGPLEAFDPLKLGKTERDICLNWDRHFRVLGSDIRQHLKLFKSQNYDESQIPLDLKRWPAKGNPYFNDAVGWPLPFTPQGLAGFFDNNQDGIYDPLSGDYPSIEIRGCDLSEFPDEMIFWVYNDEGGGAPHARSGADAIQMEVQVQAFGYQTADVLNDMTFQRYKLINRAKEPIDSCFFAFWCDPDLGCPEDDYIGVDSVRSLAYIYNQDGVDGQPGAACVVNNDNVPTYGSNIPALGIDYFRGPLDENGDSLGMTSFIYMNRAGGSWPTATTDATVEGEYYDLLTGFWKDDTPITFGGSGYSPGGSTKSVKYCFPSVPTDASGWSMCTANLAIGDRRTLQATGPFRLLPNAVNELIVGVPWVAGIGGNCPDLSKLFRADDFAQGLFNNCFGILEGPPNPPLDFVELDREIVVVLRDYLASEVDYDSLKQEKAFDAVPPTITPEQRLFKFQGYRIFQLANANVSSGQYGDINFAREVAIVDIKDTITKLYNWDVITNPTGQGEYYIPRQAVASTNSGIQHTFTFKDDAFAIGNEKRMVNHKEYYYSIIAYAHNNWDTFKPFPAGVGQKEPYLAGRLDVTTYTTIPHPTIDAVLQSKYGSGVPITRYEGVGAGGSFLDLSADTKAKMPATDADGILTYEAGKGPFDVTIFNPLEVKKGDFELRIIDGNLNDSIVGVDARWELFNLTTNTIVASEATIAKLNEQIVAEYGFSITVAQTDDAGQRKDALNGAIDVVIDYKNPAGVWLEAIPDRPQVDSFPFNFIDTEDFGMDQILDPERGLSTIGNGGIVPFSLCNWRHSPTTRLITPMWMPQTSALVPPTLGGDINGRRLKLARLPNVDIVMTSDKTKWSRCVVVETANFYYTGSAYPKDAALRPQGPDETSNDPAKWRRMFDTRASASVDKDGKPDGTGDGFGWFPGYAVDVETGRRLNVFFGENSCYKAEIDPTYTGRDMLFNPTSTFINTNPLNPSRPEYYDFILGCQHFMYVTDETYDECKELGKAFNPANFSNSNTAASGKRSGVGKIQWTGMMATLPTASLRSVADGLIPTETTIKCRVQNPYQRAFNPKATENKGYPRYRFSINGEERRDLGSIEKSNALDQIRAVPNPYYGFSDYENTASATTVKITNLPGVCNVTIYSIDGKYIRDFKRNEQYSAYNQITDAIDWDLKNSKGIPIASGVYIIHIKTPDAERTIKWFGISRKFDPGNQ